jgi:hypothetical protein
MEVRMSRNLQTTLGLIMGAVIFLFLGLVTVAALSVTVAALSDGSVGCVFASGRSVTVIAAGWQLGMSNTVDTATIGASGDKIVVSPKSLEVDGRVVATIDAGIKNIEVKASKREVIFIGDGRSVATWRQRASPRRYSVG